MLIKDKDILADEEVKEQPAKVKKNLIDKKNMKSAWGDAFDYYIRGTTEKYLRFRGRATRLEFWGFYTVLGMVLLVLYALGLYIEIPLALYYLLASIIPAIAVAVRRLHDTHKNAAIYLGIGIIFPLTYFFIGYWAIMLVLLWGGFLLHLFSKETVLSEGFYGEPNPDDEVYGDDSIRIIHKFRLLALSLFVIIGCIAFANFDNWSKQAQYRSTNAAIMEMVEQEGKKAGLTDAQIKAAKDGMKQTLKSWNGKTVQKEDITKAIEMSLPKMEQNKK